MRRALLLACIVTLPILGAEPTFTPPAPQLAIYHHLNGTRLNEPMGVFYEPSAGELFVADTGNGTIGIFDAEGLPRFTFRPTGASQPVAVMADVRGTIYVLSSTTSSVHVYSYRGESRGTFEFRDDDGPIDVSITAMTASANRLVFADRRSHRVLVYDLDRRFKYGFGHEGKQRGALSSVVGLAVGPDGEIAVSDRDGIPIQLFSPAGRVLASWGEHNVGDQHFSTPAGLAVDAAGRVWVADTLRQDVKVFDRNGEFLSHFGGVGVGPGQVRYPVDVALGPAGEVFVCEKIGRRIQVLKPRSTAE